MKNCALFLIGMSACLIGCGQSHSVDIGKPNPNGNERPDTFVTYVLGMHNRARGRLPFSLRIWRGCRWPVVCTI